MLHKEKNVSISNTMLLLLVFVNVFILKFAFIKDESWYLALIVTVPLLILAIYKVRQKHP